MRVYFQDIQGMLDAAYRRLVSQTGKILQSAEVRKASRTENANAAPVLLK